MDLAVVVLAAGEGTRMKSSLPKVLHKICGRPIISYVINAVQNLKPVKLIVVVGHQKEKVMENLDNGIEVVAQESQLGTGHAVLVVEQYLSDYEGSVLVLSGDSPLIKSETLLELVQLRENSMATAAILTAKLKDPGGYGRIIRHGNEIIRIVEEKDATVDEVKNDEVNSGIYCFDNVKLFDFLKDVKNENQQKEYYLTDVIGVIKDNGEKVVSMIVEDEDEILGINSRRQQTKVDEIMRKRINYRLMDEGVTFIDPNLSFVGPDVIVGKDTVIYPLTFLEGETSIGEGCEIGPSARLVNATIGKDVKIQDSVISESIVGDGANIGPFCSLRKGTEIKKRAKVGTFVEIKKSEVGVNSKVPHLSYIGDATIGDNVNIGAGSITCNYDGIEKHRTIIEDDVFIGSDTMLVAPLRVHKGAMTGAGSTITSDVPAESLAVERSEQRIVKDYLKKKLKKNNEGEND